MAIINDRKTFIQSVSTLVAVDMGVQGLLFPKARPRTTKLIEYDYATVKGASAAYSSFARQAEVVEKDGKSRIILAPINFNESISKDEIYADAEKFGENEYGDGTIDAVTESALTGVAKLQLRAEVGTKKAMYEALYDHKITGGYQTKSGTEDIVFNTPAGNKKVLSNAGAELYWDNANATPVTNLYDVYASMIIKPTVTIMESSTYGLFYSSAEVRTADNSSSGKKANFIVNEARDVNADFFKAGTLMEKDMMLDVYVERGTYTVGGTDTAFLPAAYVVLGSRGKGTTEFGGIPVAKEGEGVVNIAAEVDIAEVISLNPPQHEVVHRTAPLPLLKNGNAFYSLKVKA